MSSAQLTSALTFCKQQLLNTATYFLKELKTAERKSRHGELAVVFGNVKSLKGAEEARTLLLELNEFLVARRSPYFFTFTKAGGGKQFLALRDRNNILIAMVPIVNSTELSIGQSAYQAPQKDEEAKKQLEVEQPKVVENEHISSPEAEFLLIGNQFAQELQQAERYAAHASLADVLNVITIRHGAQCGITAVQQLNSNLELARGPYRFSIEKMSNGQAFLTLRDLKRTLIGAIPFAE